MAQTDVKQLDITKVNRCIAEGRAELRRLWSPSRLSPLPSPSAGR